MKKRVISLVSVLLLITCFAAASGANALERKKPGWLASCPEVIDVTPEIPTPKTIFLLSPSGQQFQLLAKNSLDFVTDPQSIIGCYVVVDQVTNPNTSPDWQIGALNRDLIGYYFINAANTTWRLTLNKDTLNLETAPGSAYYSEGAAFKIDSTESKAVDCKVKEYFKGELNLGFPRNTKRVTNLGVTNNLILVVDFPDAPLTENTNMTVENVLAPKMVENFYYSSSNGKFRPTFTIFPTVIRLDSLEKSFAPNPSGGFLVNGVMQDHRLVLEAVKIAKTYGSLMGFESINVFVPTAISMGYYGSAFAGLPIDLGGTTTLNSQLIGGTIGTINSPVPSWKVFAHEYGHLLGMYDYYLQGTGNSGRSPGPFDLMGNTSGTSNSFLGFQRWVQGWLEDADVDCDVEPNSSISHNLSPLNNFNGNRLYVHPLDGSTALVVEFRTNSEFDRLGENSGLLVYLVDMKVRSSKGPISIQASEQDKVLNPSSDVQRYSTAPLSTGQFVTVKDLVIYADKVGTENATFRVFNKSDFLIKQEADAKAAAELKVKVEADAKAAAEKAAAELKAKQDADAKAAAELKAYLDAKATAALKKKTITCVKGKLTKKVIAVKPVCPVGYKKKI